MLVDNLGIERLPIGAGEYEIVGAPRITRPEPIPQLTGSVSAQDRRKRLSDAYGSLGGLGLRGDQPETSDAVSTLDSLQLLLHMHDVAVQVHITPAQPKKFSLPDPGAKC